MSLAQKFRSSWMKGAWSCHFRVAAKLPSGIDASPKLHGKILTLVAWRKLTLMLRQFCMRLVANPIVAVCTEFGRLRFPAGQFV
jgi:hypothetical protein